MPDTSQPGPVTRVLAPDGVALAVHELGTGEPLVCLPGGPMRASRYLGDLGGLSGVRRLVRPDLRGTGASAPSPDPAGYRTDRLVPDVEALRQHLGLDRMDVLGHSAGASLAIVYAARHPERVRRLVLVTPSLRAVGIAVPDEDRRAVADLRADEPWFPAASAALHALAAGTATEDDEEAVTPFFYGRYDDAARAHHAGAADEMNTRAATASVAAGAFDPRPRGPPSRASRRRCSCSPGSSTSTRRRSGWPSSPRSCPTGSSPSSRERGTTPGWTTPTRSYAWSPTSWPARPADPSARPVTG